MRFFFRQFLAVLQVALAAGEDQFNYRETAGTDYGPEDWGKVTCDEVGECPGWPDGWELGIGWSLNENICQWCPVSGHNCGLHWQSPIDLLREDSTTGHNPICYDYHWMAYEDRSCLWHDIIKNGYTPEESNFRIRRHSLQILQPVDDDGNLQCDDGSGQSTFPRLDYSKGFPQWWHLSHTEVTVPSEHTQQGKRYDAEVHLAHFYEIDHERQLGKVAIFLEADSSANRWPFLDKLICQWREVEDKARDECGLDSAPPYPGCRNPGRQTGETDLPFTDPYPFVDCDSVQNSFRMCKPNSCCEEIRSTSQYCSEDVYGQYGDETIGSVCWWCCPGKLLAPAEANPSEPPPTLRATGSPSGSPMIAPTAAPIPVTMAPVSLTTAPVTLTQPTPSPIPTEARLAVTATPVSPTNAPTSPTVSRVAASSPASSGPVVCSDYNGHPTINLNRICKVGSCCESPRSAKDHCHVAYSFFGDRMEDVCSECCNPAREVGPSPPPHPTYPWIDCAAVNNPFRICKPNSCCESTQLATPYCQDIYGTYGNDVASICWYCCSEQKDIGSSGPPPSPAPQQASTSSPVMTTTDQPVLTPSPPVRSAPISSKSPPMDSPPTPAAIGGVVCSDYDGNNLINLNRVCKDGGCCDPERSSSNDCHIVYEFFGDAMANVCSDCCNPSKQMAPPPPTHPTYLPISCSLVNNPFRICKPNSCCDATASDSSYCQDTYETYGDVMGSICWYCCSEPKEVVPIVLNIPQNLEEGSSQNQEIGVVRRDIFLPHGRYASELNMDPANFEVNDNLEEEYIAGIEEYRTLRKEEDNNNAQESRRLSDYGTPDYNYPNVRYSPYEWMREVKTEYYYRYEGGQMVPPCFETVHYRVMKDPIRIHPDQLAELERLLAWRIAPKGSGSNECERDTAGIDRAGGDGNAVDLNRPLQAYSNIHRKVFCECKDWVSKWEEDIAWCEMAESERWYSKPYNFESNGEF